MNTPWWQTKTFLVCWLVVMLDYVVVVACLGTLIGIFGLWYLLPILIVAQIWYSLHLDTIIDRVEKFFGITE